MEIISRNQILKLNQKTITNDGYVEHNGSDMTIGEFEKLCKDENNIEINNITCQNKWSYIKKEDGNWYSLV